MKIFLLGIILSLFFSMAVFADGPIQSDPQSTPIFSPATKKFDGDVWLKWTSEMKIIFISGFGWGTNNVALISGASYLPRDEYSENRALELINPIIQSKLLEQVQDDRLKKYIVAWKKKLKKGYTAEEVRLMLETEVRWRSKTINKYVLTGDVTQLCVGLDLFYNDFKNLKVGLIDAIYIVNKQISGASSEEISAILEWVKSPDGRTKWVTYKDREGNTKHAGLP